MEIITRAQGIILRPKEEWEKIKAEPTTVADLFKSYVIILASIPAVAQFIGYWLVGVNIPFRGNVSVSFGFSLSRAVVSYVFSLITVFVLALIIDALAPTFSSKPNQLNALKLAAYSLTPYFVAGIFNLIPVLSILILLASLYGLYVLYLGFQSGLMETPPEKVMGYFVLTIVAEIVLWLVISLILGAIFSLGTFYRGV
ncbi:MAG: YIP1 family protein [Candidatus Aminicenantes bacterium]|nr:YIP1 family protein [Candidatus Aminicenantes bacterium]